MTFTFLVLIVFTKIYVTDFCTRGQFGQIYYFTWMKGLNSKKKNEGQGSG